MTSPIIPASAGPDTDDDVRAALGPHYTIRSSRVIDLNVFTVRVLSNITDFAGYAFFSRFAPPERSCAYELVLVDLDHDPIDPALIEPLADRGYRADRFRGGSYITHHFGPPAHLVTRGNRIYVFGRELERTLWPYFTKRLLTDFAVDRDLVHLKAAAFVQPSGATLLFGRQKGGKTVFLTQACAAGARFVSNTHVLTRGTTVYGVPSAMRIRNGPGFDRLIASGRLEKHLEASEYRLDPETIFGRASVDEATVRNLCIIDYNPDRAPSFDEVGEEEFTAFLDLFACAPGTYGLKDDMLAHLDNDVHRYSAAFVAMKRRMGDLVRGARRFSVNADMLDPAVRERVLARLAEQ
ncbi:FomB family phosphonate monophosphate kinase [Streptomyces sp. XM4011]|uniref:FomB family phosphonate monophosphate kinase n=1 Tax=Streptomyces sp. XM4011 TaxID=2929780 RepID=UPI001FF80E11|nr:FomB family phosphonate monophosphate kinase [Streptomyces sp. XM4011]MCK1813739.1 FomB family phosphonate monophosphate kinase [Streptomyces sp. XM4011]